MANRHAVLVAFAFPILLAACGGPPPAPDTLNGVALFKSHCALCHGQDGKDKVNPNVKIDMTSPEWQKSLADEQIVNVIKQGLPAKGMPPFVTTLPDDQINAIIKDEIRGQFGKEGK